METLKPKLRFPKFEGNWNKDKLGNLFNISAGGDIKPEFISQTKNETFKYPIYANAEKNKGFYAYSSIYKIEEDVITIAGRGVNIGIAHARREKFYPIVRLLVLKPKNNYSVDFFEYGINNFDIVIESTGVPQLTAPQISNYEIFYPDYNEQTKIANFLTSIDEKINLLKEKKSLLEEYKKGIMQKIFNQEIRFKDDNGNDFEDWEEKKLGQVSTKESSNISANKIEDNFGDYIIYGASGVLKKVDFYLQENDYISIIKDGAGVGRIFYCEGKTSVLGTMEMIKPNEEIDTYFLYCLLNNIDFTAFITGSTIPHIYYKDYSKVKCGIPSFKEQTKIANFLSAIDEKIELVSNQIQDTQEYKKGLLQQMFV